MRAIEDTVVLADSRAGLRAVLEQGNVGDPQALTRLLGRAPLPVSAFVDPVHEASSRRGAILRWMAPLLRWSVAFMWIIAGIVSLGPRRSEGLDLLGQIGVPATMAPVLLVSAAAVDLAFGVFTLLPRRSRLLWTAQLAFVLVYTAIISVFLPGLWLEPFGPVAKNVPILVLLLLLRHLEDRR